MVRGLRAVIYYVDDINKAKEWVEQEIANQWKGQKS